MRAALNGGESFGMIAGCGSKSDVSSSGHSAQEIGLSDAWKAGLGPFRGDFLCPWVEKRHLTNLRILQQSGLELVVEVSQLVLFHPDVLARLTVDSEGLKSP